MSFPRLDGGPCCVTRFVLAAFCCCGAALLLVLSGCRTSRREPPPGEDAAPGPCKVEKLEWLGVARNDGETNFEKGGNPAARGGGDRVFPDRNHPGGTADKDDLHDRVLVRATLSAASPETATVTFRLFDMDHYSPDTDFDPNGATDPADNVKAGEPLTLDVAAELRTQDFLAAATSAAAVARVATLGLQLTHIQPGNNWKVAASCEAAPLEGIVIAGDGQTLLTAREEEAPAWPSEGQTPLLTVWRRVYAEIDRMANPVLNVGVGQSQFNGGGAAAVAGAANDVTLALAPNAIAAGLDNQFQQGRIELLDNAGASLGRPFLVRRNSTGASPVITLFAPVPAGVASFRNLVDDDISNRSPNKVDTSADMAPDTSAWAGRLEPALVVPVFDQPEVAANNSTEVAFDVHIGDDTNEATELAETKAVILANKSSTSEAGFWVLYQLGAFQGRIDISFDPREPGLGISSKATRPANDREAGTVIFAEVTRDVPDTVALLNANLQPGQQPTPFTSFVNLKAINSVHEIMHEFGLSDPPTANHGPLMDAGIEQGADTDEKVKALQINGAGLRKIMLTKQPGHAPQ